MVNQFECICMKGLKYFNLFFPAFFSYAPWCPACQQIELIWESFAKESEHLDITVGKVDVTQEPGIACKQLYFLLKGIKYQYLNVLYFNRVPGLPGK